MELPDEIKKQLKELLEGGDADAFVTKLSEACKDLPDMPHALDTALSCISSRWLSEELPWTIQKLTVLELANLVRSFHFHIFLGRIAQWMMDREEK